MYHLADATPTPGPEAPAGQGLAGASITAVEAGSLAAELGLRPGDELLAVNGQAVRDIIDVHFYAAEDDLELRVRRRSDEFSLAGARRPGQALGLEFAHPTFDVDILRCNNRCAFCFVLQMAPGMRRSLYVKDDDYRYSFLFGQYVTLTNLSESDWARIAQQRLSPLYISVHATPLQARRQALGNPDAPDIMAQLRWLVERGIQVHTQIVVAPGLNDGAVLEHSVFDLAALYPGVQSVSIVPVGITRHHQHGLRPNTPAEMKVVLKAVHAWQKTFAPQMGVRFVYATDEWYLALGRPVPGRAATDDLDLQENGLGQVRAFLDDAGRQVRRIRRQATAVERPTVGAYTSAGERFTLVTGALFAPTLRQAGGRLSALTGRPVEVIAVTNHHFGESVTVAGLLTARDVIEQLHGCDLGQRIYLPRIMFNHPSGVSLDDVSPQEVECALGRPVALADTLSELEWL